MDPDGEEKVKFQDCRPESAGWDTARGPGWEGIQ